MGNFSNYWDLTTLFTKLKNKLKSISDKIDNSVSLKTATGNPITITDAANANAEELSMTIEPVQSGSGDPSPTNVRPISGLTSGEVQTTNGTDTNTATITLGRTVYGGSVNFKTGEVTVTHGIVDLGTLNWVYNTNGGFSSDTLTDIKTGLCEIICSSLSLYPDSFIWGDIADIPDYSIAKNAGNKDIYVKDTDYTTATAFKTAMSGVQLCYELATPTTLTLTPAELELLKGNNTITANGAEISIKYYPDNAIGALAGRVDGLDNTTSDMQAQIDSKASIYKATVDLSSLDQDTYYPVTGTTNNWTTPQRIRVNVALDSGTKPSWSTHNNGFSVTLDVLTQGGGWGSQRPTCHILIDTFSSVSGNISPCAYTQMTNSSTPVIWCRGGGKYYIYTDYNKNWTVRTSTYTVAGQSVSPTTTKPENAIMEVNGYFGGAAHYVRDNVNGKNLAVRWGGESISTANHIAAFNTNGTEIAPLHLATLGSLLNIDKFNNNIINPLNNYTNNGVKTIYQSVLAYINGLSASSKPRGFVQFIITYDANTMPSDLPSDTKWNYAWGEIYFRGHGYPTATIMLHPFADDGAMIIKQVLNSEEKTWQTVLTDKSLETKYLHYISIQRYNNDAATIDVTIPIINNTATTMTKTEILTYLDEHESRIKPIHGMYHSIYQGNFVLPEPIVDFIYTYYEGSEDKKLIFYRFDNDETTVTSTNQYLRIEDRFVVQIVQNA